MTPDGLLAAYGTARYVLGLISGARLIPWLVDRGWFPVRPHHELLFPKPTGLPCAGAR
jgi:hypothetical protein